MSHLTEQPSAPKNGELRDCAKTQTAPWLCTCREPMTAGVLHRWDRPCYRVADDAEVQ